LTLHSIGRLPCCRREACWRSRVVKLEDESDKNQSLCELPILGLERPVGKCMAIIKPQDVTRAVELCYEGGALVY
jgi:hypothetical protein